MPHHHLLTYSAYYRALDPELQAKFLRRQEKLLKKLEFLSMEGLEISPGMIALISGAMIQVTLGLRRYIPTYFTTVRVAPDSYTHPAIPSPMKGDVNLDRGRITLSWPAVREGYLIEDDAQNTALHEVSHCLDLETTILGKRGYFFDQELWEAWETSAMQRLANQLGRPVSRNTHHSSLKELFATTVEIFFERPEALHQLSPGIFTTVSKLLKQDPRNAAQPLLR